MYLSVARKLQRLENDVRILQQQKSNLKNELQAVKNAGLVLCGRLSADQQAWEGYQGLKRLFE